jgi:hypothetical protein
MISVRICTKIEWHQVYVAYTTRLLTEIIAKINYWYCKGWLWDRTVNSLHSSLYTSNTTKYSLRPWRSRQQVPSKCQQHRSQSQGDIHKNMNNIKCEPPWHINFTNIFVGYRVIVTFNWNVGLGAPPLYCMTTAQFLSLGFSYFRLCFSSQTRVSWMGSKR